MKKQIAIIAGGDSSEHDVSLRSAAGILSFMDTDKYDCYIVEQQGRDMHVDVEDPSAASGKATYPIDLNDFSYTIDGKKHTFNFAYITIHGTPGENGILQGYFDLIGMPYSTSDVLVESLTFNKYALNNYLRSLSHELDFMPREWGGFHMSDSIVIRKGETRPSEEKMVERLGLPCFVKPNAGGSSFGVTKVKSIEELTPAIDKAMHESDEVMVERLLVGTEITCGCFRRLNGNPVTFPITEVVVKGVEFFDYEAKYEGKSDEITPARIHPETARRVSECTKFLYEKLGCYGIIRIDYILSSVASDGTPLSPGHELINILEINTTPGMTPASFIPQQVRASEYDIKDVLSEIIEGRLSTL